MSTRTIIFGTVGIGILIIIGAVSLTRTPEPVNGATGTLAAEAPEYDFGTISMAAGKVKHSYTITNDSDAPVVVTKVYTSCMCTTATLNEGDRVIGPFGMAGMVGAPVPTIQETIAPHKKAEIEAEFDPAAHGPQGVGPVRRVIYIETQGGPTLELSFSAVVTP